MEEIKSAYDILSRLGHRQAEINKALDGVAEAHANLTAKQAGFGELMDQAEALMKANPDVEAVECGGTGQVLVRLPSGGVSVLALSHWCELGMPAKPEPEPEPQVLPAFKADDVPLIPAHEAAGLFKLPAHEAAALCKRMTDATATATAPRLTCNGGFNQDVHDRIQPGKASQTDVDLMAASHAWASTFDDPDLPEEEE